MKIVLAPVSSAWKSEFLRLVAQSGFFLRKWVQAPSTDSEFQDYLKRTRRKTSKSYFILERDGKGLVGVINISNIVRGFFQSAYLGYYVFKPYARRGYMTEALEAALEEAFTTLDLHRLEANIQPANGPSKKVAEKVGFRLEGYSPRYLTVGGRWRDHERWAITVEDWEKERRKRKKAAYSSLRKTKLPYSSKRSRKRLKPGDPSTRAQLQ